jgi:hypothetical protein
MEPRVSLSCSQEPATGPWPEPVNPVQTHSTSLGPILILSHYRLGLLEVSLHTAANNKISLYHKGFRAKNIRTSWGLTERKELINCRSKRSPICSYSSTNWRQPRSHGNVLKSKSKCSCPKSPQACETTPTCTAPSQGYRGHVSKWWGSVWIDSDGSVVSPPPPEYS